MYEKCKTHLNDFLFFVCSSVLEQIFNCQFPNHVDFVFAMLCIGYYDNCALKWLDVDFCNGSFALYETTVQPSDNVTLGMLLLLFSFTPYHTVSAECTDPQH